MNATAHRLPPGLRVVGTEDAIGAPTHTVRKGAATLIFFPIVKVTRRPGVR